MMREAVDLWNRALTSLEVARRNAEFAPDDASSRAYYAVFYAVSAHFRLEGREFNRHSTIEAAVHRDLVHAGLWPADLGRAYSDLLDLRGRGDYGVSVHATPTDIQSAVEGARRILEAIHRLHPDVFPLPGAPLGDAKPHDPR